MEKLSAEEAPQTPLLSKGKTSPFYLAIIRLKKGEGVRISKQEWNLGNTPGRICCYIMKKFPFVKYTYGQLPDQSGWEIWRVE
jgi:hypothetical protein